MDPLYQIYIQDVKNNTNFDTDLNKDQFHSEIQLALEIKSEKALCSECIGMIFFFNIQRNKDCYSRFNRIFFL